MRKAFLYILLIICIIGCTGNSANSRILSKDKMELVMWDFIQADVFTEQFIKKDSLKNPLLENTKLQQQIFTIHQVSKEEFYESYAYYTTHPDLMKTILDSVSAKQERNRTEMIKFHAGQK